MTDSIREPLSGVPTCHCVRRRKCPLLETENSLRSAGTSTAVYVTAICETAIEIDATSHQAQNSAFVRIRRPGGKERFRTGPLSQYVRATEIRPEICRYKIFRSCKCIIV
jgi:hypothetical protein